MAPAHVVGLVGRVEFGDCELADGLEHHEPLVPPPEQALVDERLDEIRVSPGHLLDRLERGAAAEDGEPPQKPPLVLGQQLVAPADRRLEGALPLGQVTGARDEEREPLVQPLEQRVRREYPDARRGELDREGQVVEPTADLRADRVVDIDVLGRHRRPLPEQLHGGRLGQRRQRVLPLGGDAQQLAARHDRTHSRTRREQRRDVAGGPDHLLEVVQQEQALGVPEMPGELVIGADRVRDRGEDVRRVADRREPDEPDPVRERGRRLAGDRDGEPRLADPARPGDGDETTVAGHEPEDVCELLLAADERVRGDGRFVR